ncbi:hypothetical protein [Actinacidiphila sp. ITFR-21]|uniref:hypothetical protein n=1 Tax=Actinacidiphila sp. ITFR-21 TaxID=3075199 RepID=UPI00288C2085|nr:hypothetical protein [Streptomyces sp. ITFR-21]WNI18876.1 hypothetical protein RLT57_27350 [Streptomyces sp. ITFR-21]
MSRVEPAEPAGASDLDHVRAVADAVLYEGYLLYPYRAGSSKNRSRWQFGVLGPPSAAPAGFAEEPGMAMQCLLTDPGPGPATVTVRLRFLQVQVREVQRREPDGGHTPVGALTVAGVPVLSWDEAVEREITLSVPAPAAAYDRLHTVPGGEEAEPLTDAGGSPVGRVVRRREPLAVRIRIGAAADDGFVRLTVAVDNEHPDTAADKDAAVRASLIGAHLVLRCRGARFVSLLEPPAEAAGAAGRCRQRRCWPVLAGPKGTADTVLGAPIILYDHPEVAEQSPGALFDSTEIDEILTLRVMTMTDVEKAEARATDPRAAEIIDRCDGMSPADLQRLHGLLRDPHGPREDPGAPASPAPPAPAPPAPAPPAPAPHPPAPGARPGHDLPGYPDFPDFPGPDGRTGVTDLRDAEPPSFATGGAPWWDPEADAAVRPGSDAVVIDGVRVVKGSLVRVHPSRRADAQDLFFAGQVARVTAVLADVDGATHVAVVLVDDPAADLHDWYGRYFYFAPEELAPLPAGTPGTPGAAGAPDRLGGRQSRRGPREENRP